MTPTRLERFAWVSLSHSHHDLEKGGPIRNEPEWRRHHPLLFFL